MVDDQDPCVSYWVLGSGENLPCVDFLSETDNVGSGPTCPKCGAPLGMLDWLPPYVVTLEIFCKPWDDFITGAGGGNGYLVSERFREAWVAAGLTGIEAFHPVKIKRVGGTRGALVNQIPVYWYISPEYDGSRLDDKASGVKRHSDNPYCPVCGGNSIVSIERVCLNGTSLSGRDLFRCTNLAGSTIGSPRFGEFVKAHGLHITKMVPCLEFNYSYAWVDELSEDGDEELN